MKYFHVCLNLAGLLCIGFAALAEDEKCPTIPILEIIEPAEKFNPKEYWKVAVIQCNEKQSPAADAARRRPEEDKKTNCEDLAGQIKEARKNGARIILTPEFSTVGFPDAGWKSRDELRPYAEKVPDGKSIKFFSDLIKEWDVYLHIAVVEDGGDNRIYNSIVVLGPGGKFVARHQKMNLIHPEENYLANGTSTTTYATAVGTIGIAICADILPCTECGKKENNLTCDEANDPITKYTDPKSKIDVLAVSSSWADCNSGMYYFSRAARKYKFYVLASNQQYYADSGVISADGSIQSHIRANPGIAYGYVKIKGK